MDHCLHTGLSRQRYRVGLVLCSLILAACGVRTVSAGPDQPGGALPGATRSGVVCGADPEQQSPLCFGEPVCERLRGPGSLRVRLPVENRSDQARRVVVQLEFLDGRSAFYGDRTTRRVLVVPPGEVRCVEATSAKERAESFVVVLTRP